MNIFDVNRETMSAGTLEKEFGVQPVASRQMEDNQSLWYAMYINQPPWASCDVRPLGLPSAIGRELARHALTEFSMTVSGGAKADYIDQQIHVALPKFSMYLDMGLCLGGVALKPFPNRDNILIDAYTTDFTPTHFDAAGKVIGGVFKSKPVRRGKEWFVKLEYHDFQTRENGTDVYVVENKALRSNQDGGIGAQVPLDRVPEWKGLTERVEIENLNGPLFAYFKPPVANRIEPNSPMGVSVYSGEVADLIRQADEQWERIWWEFKSGERKIFADNIEKGQLADRLFIKGIFTRDGNLFETFSPEYRHAALYDGLQYILKIIEFNVGLAFGTISDPQSVNKTATEEIMTKHRQYVTEGDIQTAFQSTLDDLIYAMSAYCDLYGLAPSGEYNVAYSWGDGILDDPETVRANKAMFMQEITAGIRAPWEYRVEFLGEDENTAKANLPNTEELIAEG